MSKKNRILIVDDDPNLLRSLSDVLGLRGFEVITTAEGKSAIKATETNSIDAALIDLNLTDMPGLDVLNEIKKISPDTECLLLTGFASQETAIEAVNRGAFAYFQKPYDIDMLILAVRRAIERRDAQIQLGVSEARHQIVAELTSDYVYEMHVDEQGGLTRSWISESFTRISGYTPEEMDALDGWKNLIFADDEGVLEEQYQRLLSNQMDFREYRMVRKDGEVRWIEDFTRPIYDQSLGRVVKIIGAARDITEKKQSQLSLGLSEARHHMIAELASDYVFEMDVDEQGDLTNSWISESFTRISGYTSEEVDQRGGWITVIHPDDVSAMEKQVERLLSNQTDISEYRIVRKDGEVRWIEEIARPIMDKSSRRVIKIIGAARDITEKKEAQAEIQAQAEKLECIYRAAPVGIGIIRDRMIIDVNERFCEITGYDNQELAGQSTRILYPSEEVYDQVGEERLKERGPTGLFMIETQYKRKDNEIIDIFLSSSPLDPSDHSRGYVFTVLDISEQKKASRELIESEEKFSLVFRNSPFAILVTDHETGQITDVNPAFTEITGYDQYEVIHQTTVDLHLWKDLGDRDLVLDLLSRGHKVIGEEYVFMRKDGEVIYGLYSADLIQLKGKTYILSSIDNITERKRWELELQVVANISEAMRKAKSKEDLQKTLVESLIDQLDLDGVTLEQISPQDGERKRIYSEGVWKGLEGQTTSAEKGIGGEVIASGLARLIIDVAKEKNLFHKEHFRNLKSAACIPLVIQNDVIGLFWVGSRREMGDLDIRLMTAIADMAANAIHRETMHEETLHRLDELNNLRSIDQAINSSQDLQLTLGLIVRQLKNLSGADAVDILIYHPELLTLQFAAGDGFTTEEIKRSSLRIGEGGAGQVALEQQPLWIRDISQAEGECVRKDLLMAEGFAAYHACPLVVKGEIKGVMEVFRRAPFSADDEWKITLEGVAEQTAIAIDNSEMFHGMKRLNTELILAYDETIEGWANALDLRDHDTEGHSRRVTDLTVRMAREAGMSPEEVVHVRRGALLHDIGKIGVPDDVLRKPGPLTDNEWIIMHEHPRIAFQLLSKIKYLQSALDIPYSHHERWDGSGYPRGLKGEEIPLPARLFTVVDVYDALTSDRPYRKAWTRGKALKYIKEQTGTHLDPYAVEIFFKTLDY